MEQESYYNSIREPVEIRTPRKNFLKFLYFFILPYKSHLISLFIITACYSLPEKFTKSFITEIF